MALNLRSLAPRGLWRQRRRDIADVPVPRYVARRAAAAHHRLVERRGTGEQIVPGLRRLGDMEKTGFVRIVRPVGLTLRLRPAAAREARPIIATRAGQLERGQTGGAFRSPRRPVAHGAGYLWQLGSLKGVTT